jgi:predicted phosphodiesterase
MRLGVIADIHGNFVALNAVMADLERQSLDQVVCLGDAVQGGPQPAETVSSLRRMGCRVVMGNADSFLLTSAKSGEEELTAQHFEVRAWTLSQLGADDLAFIRAFEPTVTVPMGQAQELLCFHGSPTSFDDIILPETPDHDVRRFLGDDLPAFLTGGHTHAQQLRRLGDSLFFNPGSVGLAYDHQQASADPKLDSWAEYAILASDDIGAGVEFRRVWVDPRRIIEALLASGRPHAREYAAQYSLV